MHVSDGHSLLHFETVPMRPSDGIDPILFTEIKKNEEVKITINAYMQNV